MVIMNLRLELSKLQKPPPKKDPQTNIINFRKPEHKQEYQQKVEEKYDNKDVADNNDRWQRIVSTCLKVGEEVLGIKERTNKSKDEEIKLMSEKRKTLKRRITDSKTPEKMAELKKESKQIKKEIDKKLKKNEEDEIDKKMEHLERIRDDNKVPLRYARTKQAQTKTTNTCQR